jgi:hypothetical protein
MSNNIKKKTEGVESGSAASGHAIASLIDRESQPDTDPHSSFWSHAPRVVAESDFY